MVQEAAAVITDRFTSKVVGLVVVALALIIDVSFLVLASPEARQKPGFAAIVIVPSLPILAYGIYLLRRADRLKEEDE
jgi:hypothetical protein